MVTSINSSTKFAQHKTSNTPVKEYRPSNWDEFETIDTLPSWVYENHEVPNSIEECKAKISRIKHTIADIDLQIEIKAAELASEGGSEQQFNSWKATALRAKQSQNYVLNAYSYWLELNSHGALDLSKKFNMLVGLLIEDPVDFVSRAQILLD